MADAFGYGTSALAGDVDKAGVVRDLVQGRQGTLRFGQELAVQVRFELQQRVVDSQAIVFHAALEQHDQFLLAREPFKDLEQLRRRGE